MDKHRFHSLALLICFVALAVAGCSHGTRIVPPPSSAKHYAPVGTLEPGQITVPFPWNQKFGKVLESWTMGRDTSGRPAVAVTFDEKTIYSFPIDGPGANAIGRPVTLGGKDYRVVSIWVNTDEPGTGSGWVTLEPAGSR